MLIKEKEAKRKLTKREGGLRQWYVVLGVRVRGPIPPSPFKKTKMTIQDIISHKLTARDFYARLPIVPIGEAWKEPLKLSALRGFSQQYENRVLTCDVAFVFECISALVGRYKRREPLSEAEKLYIAERCCEKFKHWSVSDFKCFEDMAVGARIPSNKSGQTEYELVAIDIPSIMGKLEAYDRMRPRSDKPLHEEAEPRPLTDWHRTHLLGGAEHVFASEAECERYWRGLPEKAEIAGIAKRVRRLYGGGSKNV